MKMHITLCTVSVVKSFKDLSCNAQNFLHADDCYFRQGILSLTLSGLFKLVLRREGGLVVT
jgi:hypothetical protein